MSDRAAELWREAGGARWGATPEAFRAALERSAAKAFAGRTPAPAERDRYFASLHLADLALACACGEGSETAWDHFVAEYRPILYRAADAIDPGGQAREAADAIHGELFSRALFRYFHGRSSLATWLRSILSQRYVDRLRETRRLDPLDDEAAAATPARSTEPDPDRARLAAAMRAALTATLAALAPRDRLRLRCYYAGEMTLAAIGRMTRESEATVSRQLARTRRTVRDDVTRRLKQDHGLSDAAIAECVGASVADPGTLDLAQLLGERKNPAADRSMQEDPV